jgi:hypothetical protein
VAPTSALVATRSFRRLERAERRESLITSFFDEACSGCCFPKSLFRPLDNIAFHHAKAVIEYAAERSVRLLFMASNSGCFNLGDGVFHIVHLHLFITVCLNDTKTSNPTTSFVVFRIGRTESNGFARR